ncbi:hypothetical protein MTP10_19895 [Nonomuraea sp. 3-1Str]|uniref:hypothetical protein n=1 Tax=Nonomuraea sp. 3-1Str TaxID=2929801 RepID=UPI00285D2C6B|nr:hypothetical protein [Nonomuraea sp. 3-1Str]MDR8410986.1 hypothetical protein [Nonomuraea sp. 3-1Str]
MDGKALRGGRLAEHGTVHLLAAFDHHSGLAPAQADGAGTTNEPRGDRLRERASAFMAERNGWMRITVRLWNTLHGAHPDGCRGNLLGKIQEMEAEYPAASGLPGSAGRRQEQAVKAKYDLDMRVQVAHRRLPA